MKNQVNMSLSKETNKALITNPKDIEIYELSDKDFWMIHLKNFRKLQEHT